MKIDSGIYKNTLPKAVAFVEGLVLAVVLTLLLLAVFAFVMLRAELSAGAENIGLTGICVIACFSGGFFCGKKNNAIGFLWGLAVGSLFYVLILTIRLIGGQNITENLFDSVTAFLYCAASGMLGGMLS